MEEERGQNDDERNEEKLNAYRTERTYRKEGRKEEVGIGGNK